MLHAQRQHLVVQQVHQRVHALLIGKCGSQALRGQHHHQMTMHIIILTTISIMQVKMCMQ